MFEVARRKMLFKSSCVYVSLFEVLGECDRPSVLFLIGSHHCVCVRWKPETFCLLQYLTHHPPATKYALYYVNAQTLISWKLNGKRYWHQENIRFTCELKNIFHTCLQDMLMLKKYYAYKCATKIQPCPAPCVADAVEPICIVGGWY